MAGIADTMDTGPNREQPPQILERALRRPLDIGTLLMLDVSIAACAEMVCRTRENRAGTRLLLACLLAKIHQPHIDPRKPYTEIGGPDSFSGRHYDEAYIDPFIRLHSLPCNQTTAFLTPAFRNITQTLLPELSIAGRPREMYAAALQLLDDVYNSRVVADDLLAYIVRVLIEMREERKARLAAQLAALQASSMHLDLSSEEIIDVVEKHLSGRYTSRLPVLLVAAAYQAAQTTLGETTRLLHAHNAADEQTGALGDVEITLLGDEKVVTCYEMKAKPVTASDIDIAMVKLGRATQRPDNYIFITTASIDQEVAMYAKTMYERTGGIEVAVLDCMGFLRHYLHLFHRRRMAFLNRYQELVLMEPDSAISPAVKVSLLELRQAAEALHQLLLEE